MNNRKHGQGTHSTKMGAEKCPMPENLSAQIVCPSPKVWDFDEKRLHWASVVGVRNDFPPHNAQCHFVNQNGRIIGYFL